MKFRCGDLVEPFDTTLRKNRAHMSTQIVDIKDHDGEPEYKVKYCSKTDRTAEAQYKWVPCSYYDAAFYKLKNGVEFMVSLV